MYFRPLPRFTVFCGVLLLILIALGVWQLERLQWKLGLIAEMNGHLHAPALSLDQILSLPPSDAQYHHVSLRGHFENDKEAYVYAAGDNGEAVFHVIVPFVLDDGRVLLVDRGIVPVLLKDPARRRPGILEGEQRITGVWRTPDPPGVFTPAPDQPHRVWYSRDVGGIAKALGLKIAAPVLVEEDGARVPGGWPRNGQTVVTLPNDHLQYAMTWFLLAASVVVLYFAYHRAQGRFAFGRGN